MELNASNKIVKAKVMLQKSNPFFAYLIAHLNISESKEIPTMAINSKGDCLYNAKFVESLKDGEVSGVLAHEVLHLALEHMLRGKNKNHTIFNIATDLVINTILVNSNFTLPKLEEGLIPHNNSFDFPNGKRIEDLDKKGAEEVYAEIKKFFKEKEKPKTNRFDEHTFSDKEEKSKEFQEVKEKWNKAFSEASVYAQQMGKLPKGMERILDAVLNEKVNWKYLLYKYLTRTLPYDYTYSRPSKKSISSGFYMPSILRENIEVVVSVDTSGSISQDELSEFLGEIVGIARTFHNIQIKLIVCDCKIHEVYDLSNGDIDKIMNLKISGGGGTNHKPIYEYIKDNLPNTKFVVNFTDGYTSFPSYEEVKTIWVIAKGGVDKELIPFGEVINL